MSTPAIRWSHFRGRLHGELLPEPHAKHCRGCVTKSITLDVEDVAVDVPIHGCRPYGYYTGGRHLAYIERFEEATGLRVYSAHSVDGLRRLRIPPRVLFVPIYMPQPIFSARWNATYYLARDLAGAIPKVRCAGCAKAFRGWDTPPLQAEGWHRAGGEICCSGRCANAVYEKRDAQQERIKELRALLRRAKQTIADARAHRRTA